MVFNKSPYKFLFNKFLLKRGAIVQCVNCQKYSVCGGKMSISIIQVRKQFSRPDCCKARRECMAQSKREGKNTGGENEQRVHIV